MDKALGDAADGVRGSPDVTPVPSPRGSRSYALLFAFLFLPYAYFNHSDGWNQISRLAELHSVVIQGSLNIDAYHIYTGDKALIDGHYYSEKAPGAALLALPVFGLTVLAQRMLGIDPDSANGWGVSAWTATAGSVGVVTALGGVAFFALLRRRMSDRLALMGTLAMFLGTLAFPYATSLFSHSFTISLLAIALWGVLDPSSRPSRDVIAGLCAGLAVASEYPAIFGVASLALYLWYHDRARAGRFGMALLPGLSLIFINNYLLTGSPFVVGYGSKPEFPMESAAHNYGYSLPTLAVIRALLFSEYRGLFFWSPVLLMAIPGLVLLARLDRWLALVILAASTLSLVQVASFYNWFGGFSIGPRYLAPAFPFLGLAAAYGIARFPKAGMILTAVSVTLMAIATAVDLAPPEDVMTPLHDYYFRRLQQGRFSANLGTLAGMPPLTSYLVLGAVGTVLGTLAFRAARRAA